MKVNTLLATVSQLKHQASYPYLRPLEISNVSRKLSACEKMYFESMKFDYRIRKLCVNKRIIKRGDHSQYVSNNAASACGAKLLSCQPGPRRSEAGWRQRIIKQRNRIIPHDRSPYIACMESRRGSTGRPWLLAFFCMKNHSAAWHCERPKPNVDSHGKTHHLAVYLRREAGYRKRGGLIHMRERRYVNAKSCAIIAGDAAREDA